MARKGFTQKQIDAAAAARDRASSGNPAAVRQAFLTGEAPIEIGPLKIGIMSVGVFWLLEEMQSPFIATGDTPRAPGFADIGIAAFIMSDPLGAKRVFDTDGRAGVRAAAFEIATTIPMAALNALNDALVGRVREPEGVMPPPAKTDKENPTASLARGQDSAGDSSSSTSSSATTAET